VRPSPTSPATAVPMHSNTTSANRRGMCGAAELVQANTRGASTSAPSRSPVHQVTRAIGSAEVGINPDNQRLHEPTTALQSAPSGAAVSRKVRTCLMSSSCGREPVLRRRREDATSASSVLPVAMATAAVRGTEVAALARRAAMAMAGQYRISSMVSAAMAIPVGGHTSEMLWPIEAYLSPSRADP